MPVFTWRVANLIGTLLFTVLIWPNSISGTFIPPRPAAPLGAFFGGHGGGGPGVGPIANEEFHTGGGNSIVFPGPNDKRAAFFGLLKLPYIICYYAAYGRWPNFPAHLQAAVLDLGRHVYAMDDYGLRNYCSKYFHVTIGHRPCCATSAILPSVGHDKAPTKTPGRRTTKKPTPAPDSEIITGEPEGGEEGEAEEPPAEEGEGEGGEDYEAGRLVDGREQKLTHGSDCQGMGSVCVPKTVPFVPLRSGKSGKQPEKDKVTTTHPTALVGVKVGRTSIPK